MKNSILDNLEENGYCIECSNKVKNLYKKYKDGFIDLVQCVSIYIYGVKLMIISD